MSAVVMEWSVLERLLLAQAVNKYGEDNWSQVAKTLKQHPLLQDHSKLETFNHKTCSLQYYLMIENMDSESPRQVKTTGGSITQDMPKVVKLARQLYFQRVDDLKNSIKEDEDRFLALISEIDDIKSGAMDSKLESLTGEPLAIEEETTTRQDSNDMTDRALGVTEGDMANDSSNHETNDNQDDTHSSLLPPDISSPATDGSYQSATAEFNDRMDEEHTQSEESKDNISPIAESERDNTRPQVDTETPTTTNLGTKRRHDDESPPPAIDVDQHASIESSLKRQRLDAFEMDTSPAPVLEGQDEEHKQAISDLPQVEQTVPADAMVPDTSKSTDERTPDATERKDSDSVNDKQEADGSESVTGSDSNAATPTATLEKRRSVSSGIFKDDPRQKSWQKNVNHLWREIANHKNGAMFMNPIKETQAPLYYDVVKYPLDLKSIKNRIRDGIIRNTVEFERDVVLMLTNSLMYNKEGTEIYQMALEMLQDVTEQIKVFKSADSNGSSHTKSISLLAKDRRKSLAE